MISRLWRGLTCAGITLAVGLLAAPGRAEAGLVLGIQIDQTILTPVGDPQYQLDFKASLLPGNKLVKGDYIVFDNIYDYGFASAAPDALKDTAFTISTTMTDNLTNVMFTYNPRASYGNESNTDSIFLGDFYITTLNSFDSAPPELSLPITYMTQTTPIAGPAGVKNQGTGVTVPGGFATPDLNAVPEPATLAMIATGLPVIALALARKRRRHAA